jgi:AcrR family transcriptional regulator
MTQAKEEWLVAGLDLLVTDGENGLRIERLCQRLGKTKGSFYHHFSGRDDFCHTLLEYWESKHTDDLIQATSDREAQKALGELDRLARSLRFDRESAFRSWATRSERAAEVVLRVDLRRVKYVEDLYQQKGLTRELAGSLAWLHYCLLLGGAQLKGLFGEPERRRVYQLLRGLEK